MLKALMLRKKIDSKKKELAAIVAKAEELQNREKELEKDIAEAETDEERAAVEEAITEFENDNQANQDAQSALEKDIAGLEKELEEIEAEQNTEPAAAPAKPAANERNNNGGVKMTFRNKVFRNMSFMEVDAMIKRDNVQKFLGEVRTCIKEKRALTNVGLLIPEEFLGLLRENLIDYSKLYKHVFVRPVSGESRIVIQGAIPEAVWTDCCANLNELDMAFNNAEFGCWKVAGYFAVCNANIEDADIDLAAELLTAIGRAIGLALDKAILYGTGVKMPLGIVARLAQTSQPADYLPTARPWVDLHTTHILTIANSVTGVDLFKTIMLDSAVIKGKYSRGEKVWVMNETTYTFLKAQAMSVNAAGAIVSGVDGTMPVIGGIVEVLDFVSDYVVLGGYFDVYALAERAGTKFMTSEHVRFLQDQTVFKGVARYDGQPVIAEAFAAIGVNGVTPDANMTFAVDDANTVSGILLDKNAATVKATKTVALKATILPANVDGTITWASSDTTKATVSDGVVTGVAAGSAIITATCGDAVAVCNVTVTN